MAIEYPFTTFLLVGAIYNILLVTANYYIVADSYGKHDKCCFEWSVHMLEMNNYYIVGGSYGKHDNDFKYVVCS